MEDRSQTSERQNTHPLRISTFEFAETLRARIDPYLPHNENCTDALQDLVPSAGDGRPFVAVTYAQSLDAMLSYSPGAYTALSGRESMAMTHYLRSRFDGILVGVGTAIADDPGLNCRLATGPSQEGLLSAGAPSIHHARPIVFDPHARWLLKTNTKMISLAREGTGRAPWILTSRLPEQVPSTNARILEDVGGEYIHLPETCFLGNGRAVWSAIIRQLYKIGLQSILIDGGGNTIASWLDGRSRWWSEIDSIIITISPVYLGKGGVAVCPERGHTMTGQEQLGSENASGKSPGTIDSGKDVIKRLTDVSWLALGEDAVLCGRLANRSLADLKT